MNKLKRNLIILIILFILVIFGIVYVVSDNFKDTLPSGIADIIENITPKSSTNYDLEELEKMWKDNYAINDDYVGQIIFDSGLINLPFVQGNSNDTYLRTDWQTMQYNIEGSVFMDSECEVDDQNMTIYGHYVYSQYDPSATHMFTPLKKLMDQENYDENKHVLIVFKDGIREYDVATVYYCQLTSNDRGEYLYTRDDLQYYWRNIGGDIEFNYDNRNISEDYFNAYKATIQIEEFYKTNVRYTKSDKFVTLQTCVENRDDLREIVILKEVSRHAFESSN